jgi:hypothetical protein
MTGQDSGSLVMAAGGGVKLTPRIHDGGLLACVKGSTPSP